ncbi:molybdate ABC transporter substrate-binding protein [soil metagenome]
MGWLALAVAVVLALLLPACGQTGSGSEAGGEHKVSVFAASSLTSAFERIGKLFEKQHPGTSVTFNFLSSSDLAAQIEQGAPANVFASADTDNAERVAASGLAKGRPRVFAHNRLVILVPAGNPLGIHNLADLQDPDLIVSLCNPECPAGKYARQAFAKAGVDVRADSQEIDVAAVSTRVATGQADAGIGYASDVVAAGGRVEGVPIPARDNIVATYPLVLLRDASPGASSFAHLVLSPQGQRILVGHGFLPP